MKPLAALIVCLLLLVPTMVGSAAGDGSSGYVVLTADQVHTAGDIEMAFHQATDYGKRPGVVVLDGRRGPFLYDLAEGNDYDINIFHSNLTLRGINQAFIQGGGIYFDNLKLKNITIASLWMLCPSDCIGSSGLNTNVTIRDNRLVAGGNGVGMAGTHSWLIKDNTIQAGGTAVNLGEVSGINVINNRLVSNIPIMVYRSHDCSISGNTAIGSWQGILLTSLSTGNVVTGNTIKGVENAGISLEIDTSENHVYNNFVRCGVGYECLTVSAPESAWAENYIYGNRP